jgi:hypothetical protein
MAITVKLFDAAGASLPEGISVELVRGAEIVARARVDNQGTVIFPVDGEGPLAVRIEASDELLSRPAPSRVSTGGDMSTNDTGSTNVSEPGSGEAAGAGPRIFFNGVRRDGKAARSPMDPAVLVATIAAPQEESLARAAGKRLLAGRAFGLLPGRSATKWEHTGWGIVFAQGASQSLRDALAALMEHRRKLLIDAGKPAFYRELEYLPGEGARAFLGRFGADISQVDPFKVPYYLLLVGGPGSIPFQVQWDLAFGYAVGRLAFDDDAGYAAYARSLVEQEGAPATTRDVVVFGTRHLGDAATILSDAKLVTPIDKGLPGDGLLANPPAKEVASVMGGQPFGSTSLRGPAATRGALLGALGGGQARPSLLFAACHGLECDPDDAAQATTQGALVCGDWKGIGDLPASALLTAEAAQDATVKGLVAFVFACHGAGTTAKDDITGDPASGHVLAKADFVAALPKGLLSHPKGSALAYIGHVNSATGFSIDAPVGGVHVEVYWGAALAILMGEPVGHAVRPFAERVGALANELVKVLMPGTGVDATSIATAWLERNDARNQIVLGDPAVRLRV